MHRPGSHAATAPAARPRRARRRRRAGPPHRGQALPRAAQDGHLGRAAERGAGQGPRRGGARRPRGHRGAVAPRGPAPARLAAAPPRGARRAVGRSFARLWARGLKRLAATMGALYVLDLGCLAAQTMGVPLGRDDVPLLAASFLYPVWFGRLASNIKRRALRVYPSREGPVAPNGDGKVLVYDRLCDVALAVFVAVVILELLSLELGVAFASLVAVSGASSVVVALACQEPLKHVINGLLLTFSDKFRPGDEISFGDVAGTVVNWGWFDTKIRQYNERTVVVPNGQIMNAKLINISRQRWGQYKTEWRLRLEDGPIMDEVVAADPPSRRTRSRGTGTCGSTGGASTATRWSWSST